MIAKIYKLPAGLTSPDDKPDLQLWNVLTSDSTYCSTIEAETVSAPDLDTITVQTGGLGDLQTQQLYLSNFINVGTFWYQITNIYYTQQTANGVYMVEGKLDIYFSFLVTFFDETTTNSNRIYFHQKHLNRAITTITNNSTANEISITTQQYLYPQIQQYLLNKHPALKDIGKQAVKTYHVINPTDYLQNINITNDWMSTSGTTTVKSGTNNQTENFNVYIDTGGGEDVQYNATNYFGSTTDSYAYPVLIIKADVNSAIEAQYYGGLFPYFLCDGQQVGGNSGQATTITVSLTNNPNNLSSYSTTIDYPTNDESPTTFTPLFNIASDYYVGLYLFPLPVLYLRNNGGYVNNTQQWNPLSNVLNQGIFKNGTAGEPTIPGTSEAPGGTQAGVNLVGEQIASNVDMYYNGNVSPPSTDALCNLLCAYVDGNTFYGVASNLTPINNNYINNDFAVIEPAVLNWMSFNVRLYGQDNLVRPLDFNYYTNTIETKNTVMTPTICNPMDSLFVYLNYFAITISPPNVMITNIPYHDLGANIFNTNGTPNYFPHFGAFNGYNDAIFSAMMKSEVPTPSTAGANYIANSKNNYDMGLNISNLLAQNAQAEVQVAKNNMGIAISNEITGVGSAIGDFFSGNWGAMAGAIGGLASGGVNIANASIEANTIAPNTADIQEMKYNYMASGKQQDMSRTTSMRVSATATTNTLNDTVYTVIDEVPPLYEQVYVVNYYALHGYIVNKGDMGKYWFNRKICNFICCSFFTNAMLPNLNINGKTKIDTLLNQGFRVGCYNDNQQVQINQTTAAPIDGHTVPYNTVLYNEFNDGDYLYNNTEVSETNGTAEIYYLYEGQEASNEDIQAGVTNFHATQINQKNQDVRTNKDSTKD